MSKLPWRSALRPRTSSCRISRLSSPSTSPARRALAAFASRPSIATTSAPRSANSTAYWPSSAPSWMSCAVHSPWRAATSSRRCRATRGSTGSELAAVAIARYFELLRQRRARRRGGVGPDRDRLGDAARDAVRPVLGGDYDLVVVGALQRPLELRPEA